MNLSPNFGSGFLFRLERRMVGYLRRHGWIVFWLDEEYRQCPGSMPSKCWLNLYLEAEKREEAYRKHGLPHRD